MGSPSNNKRKAPRRRVRLRVRYWQDDLEGSGYTADASATGLFIESIKTPNAGGRLHLEIALADGPFFAEAVVARTVKAPRSAHHLVKSGFGVRFIFFGETLPGGTKDTAEVKTKSEAPTGALKLDLSDPKRLVAVYANEISKGGLLIASDEQPSRGSEATVVLTLPRPHEKLTFKATVVQTISSPPSVALTFLDKKPAQRLSKLVADIHAKGVSLMLDLTDPQRAISTLNNEIRHGGVFVPTASPPAVGTAVQLTIGLPPPNTPLQAKGKVVSILTTPAGAALELERPQNLAASLDSALQGVPK